ncbi:MAG TPA: hydrolase [Candidatus Nitrosotalea sp.]|nr:hydrolase [Candidatus Nitrosotalea sp.]
MPVTGLDPRTALVVIDMQKGILARETIHPVADVLAKVVRLVDAFRAKQRPVVLVRVGWSQGGADALKSRTQAPPPSAPLPADFFEYADELHADPQRDILVHKRQWGAFYGTDLDLQLRRRSITNIVLCGISTSIGVESTARDAWERSYNLTFASDAMTDTVADGHDRALRIIFPRLGEIGTTDEILKLLHP